MDAGWDFQHVYDARQSVMRTSKRRNVGRSRKVP